MKQILIAALILFASAATLSAQSPSSLHAQYEKEPNGPHADCDTSWTTMQHGLEYRRVTCLGDPGDTDLHVVRIDQDRWNLDADVISRARARDVARSHSAGFVINGNFFDRQYDPLGAVMRSGSVVQPPRASSWQSVFVIGEDGKARIIMPSAWKSWKNRVTLAVQAGPRLVIAGHTNKSIRNNYAAARCGVCIRRNGDLLFFATPQDRKFHITEIARVARRDESDGGLACRDAMLFDGGHSVNFYVDGDKPVDVEGDPVPVYVVATPK